MYKLNRNSASITRLSDGASIPNDPANTDYARYLEWVAAGNAPTPADPPSAAETNAPVIAQITALESTQHRVVREAALGKAGAAARLQAIDDQIVVLRAQLVK